MEVMLQYEAWLIDREKLKLLQQSFWAVEKRKERLHS